MENKICKIVYFDEDSVTDYVQIIAGGTLENTEELLKTREASEDQNAQATGKGGIGGVFKALLGWEASASAELSAGLSFNSNKMVKNIVKKKYIITNWYEAIIATLKDDEKEIIHETDILEWFLKNAERYDNIRILKTKLENAIFDKLAEAFVINPVSNE